MDWCPYINTRVNHAVSYMVAFFNYAEAFSLRRLTKLTLTGFQGWCKVCHLLEWPFNSLRAFYGKQWKCSLQVVCSSISQYTYSPLLFLQEQKKISSYYIKHIDTCLFLDPVMSNHINYGYWRGVSDKFQSLISQKRKLIWNFKLQKPIVGYRCELLWV